jgi:hypothetical protein
MRLLDPFALVDRFFALPLVVKLLVGVALLVVIVLVNGKHEAASTTTITEAAQEIPDWSSGYEQQDANVYWKWVEGRRCRSYAQHGCWHVAVITADGCPNYVAVQANEYSGSAIINELLDNQGYGIPPLTERIFELDASQAGATTAGNVSVECT